jgi:signal transduction histidine kinase
MKVRDRLLLAFLLVMAVLAMPSGYALLRFAELRDLAVENRVRHAEAVVALGEVQTAVSEVDRLLRSYVATPSQPLQLSLAAALDRLADAVREVEAAGYAGETGPLAVAVDTLVASARQAKELVAAERLDAATDRVLDLGGGVGEVRRRVVDAASALDRRAERDFRRADAIAGAGRDAVVFALVAALAVAVVLAVWTTGALAGPLERLRRAMARVTEGTLEAPPDLPYDRSDEIGALSASFRTMTRRLAELDRLKVEFIGMASHEMQTPVNVVRGYTELLEAELDDELSQDHRDILQRIAEQTGTMSRLARRLMDISKLEAGSLEMEVEAVAVEELLSGIRRRYEILARNQGVDLRVVRAPGAPAQVSVDVDLIRDEVLGNLVSNALRFTPRNGTVRVEARPHDGGLLVEVRDTGPGVPEEHRPHVFERYYRADRSRGLGTGLGLAICRQIAEAHGGWVRLAEDGTPGATFQVFLPVRAALREAG